MKSILDPTFKYTSSANTDIRKTFERVRREMRATPRPAREYRGGVVRLLAPVTNEALQR